MAICEISNQLQVTRESRVLPRERTNHEQVLPLSLLDATTAKFGHTSAIWLLERPTVSFTSTDLVSHLREALSITLDAYPQWCGFLKAILSIEKENHPPETAGFPTHAKRYGRVYVHYGINTDPGVDFVEAKSTLTVDGLYTGTATNRWPIWNRKEGEETFSQFVPPRSIANALEPIEKDTDDLFKPIMAVQCTELACGGVVLAAKIAHPLADITALTRFVRDWASVSRAMINGTSLPALNPGFEPFRLDACAAGDINADDADPAILEHALSLPLHRYDWWASPFKPPPPFPSDLPPAGKPLPWAEWDSKAPVDTYTVHFSREQIHHLWKLTTTEGRIAPSQLKISKHDALLAHVWSCIVRARGLQEDEGPVHCDLVLGTRPAFQLDDTFIGSPTMMLNIETTASDCASGNALGPIAQRIRETVSTVNDRTRLAAHLHSIAYEKSPQRIWQGFLGRRHTMVTTWARAGIYDVHFGLGSRIRYADGVVPCVDGCILIVDGPPKGPECPTTSTAGRDWTAHGVDITFQLRCEDMERLLQDPLLLPQI